MPRTPRALRFDLVLAALAACGGGAPDPVPVPQAEAEMARAAAESWRWALPDGIAVAPEVPGDNHMSERKVRLGHSLFMDRRLSVDGSTSCYGCHRNELGNADGRATAVGPGGKVLPRNTPTIWNVAYRGTLYWDGRAASLEAQALGAWKGPGMGIGDGLEAKAAQVGALPEYAEEFRAVFELPGDATIEPAHVAKAIAAYERTLLCGNTRADRGALDAQGARGKELFMGRAGCATCHHGPDFTDGLFHRVGVGRPDDAGRFDATRAEEDRGKFRTPTLRNVARTAPYFHDGSVGELREAVRIMASGGGPGAAAGERDPLLQDRHLTEAEIADITAFLRHLDCPGRLVVLGDQGPAPMGPQNSH